ncbi:unnamed protein product [Hyaloperonospora brassicae]|uniref:RxLR effector candidate protein n=1 Tax=Hyaloperonospora brassicae TaxID=162125 RepID=A0AAV0SXI9_HYABA|nr:unnamed protein product [Hyaloperonospora brassicae]
MRLVLVVYALTLCCCSFGRAYGIVPVAEQESGPEIAGMSTGNAVHFLKGSEKEIKAEAEDEERALNPDHIVKLETASERVPFATNFKQFVNKHFQFGDGKSVANAAKAATGDAKTGTDQAKAVAAEAPKEFTKLEAWKIIMKGQVKPLTIIAAIALAGGYVVYLVKG